MPSFIFLSVFLFNSHQSQKTAITVSYTRNPLCLKDLGADRFLTVL